MVASGGVGDGGDLIPYGGEALLAGLEVGGELIFEEASDEALH